jgi:tetratricopeptide (TPR) repeat protein
VSWGHQARLLAPGEAVTLQVVFANLPLRRFTLLVESSGAPCHLNVRRDHDGSLLHDARDEVRHEIDVPWGEGESLTAVLTAGPAGGTFDVSFWGPPADAHKRAYSYHVNRALEAHAAGDAQGVRDHCRAALQSDPGDAVARLLLRRLDNAEGIAVAAGDSTGVRREEAAALIASGRLFEALAILDAALATAPDAASAALVLSDLGGLHLALANPVQARICYQAARDFGLPADLDAAAARALAALPAAEH